MGLIFCFQWFVGSSPTFDTDRDPGKLYGSGGSGSATLYDVVIVYDLQATRPRRPLSSMPAPDRIPTSSTWQQVWHYHNFGFVKVFFIVKVDWLIVSWCCVPMCRPEWDACAAAAVLCGCALVPAPGRPHPQRYAHHPWAAAEWILAQQQRPPW